MLKRQISIVLIAVLLLSTIVVPASAQNTPQPGTGGVTVPVTGQARGAGRISGAFTVMQFVPDTTAPSGIAAVGKLQLFTANGRSVVTNARMPVTLPSNIQVTAADRATKLAGLNIQLAQLGACDVLDLTLGPLDLNLLGLEIHLNTVHLVIEANPAGGLLGALLAALCQPQGLAGIIQLLNSILDVLNAINSL